MDDTAKRDENIDREDKPAVRFETVVEPTEEVEGQQEHKLELPHRMPPEMPKDEPEGTRVEETKTEETQGSRFDELARALGDGGVEAGTEINNKRTAGRVFSWGWVAFLLIFVFGSGLGMAGGYVMWGKQFEILSQPSSSSTDDNPQLFQQGTPKAQAPTPVVISTPGASERTRIALQILNGSGVVGGASDLKDYLEGLGYKGVVVGNASRSDYVETKISIKDSKKALLQILTADLGKKVSVSTAASTLSETSGYDAIVTLGKK